MHLSRPVIVLGAFATFTWFGFFVLLPLQIAGVIPPPIDIDTGLIAMTLTIIAVQIAKQGPPAREYEPAPFDDSTVRLDQAAAGPPRPAAVVPPPRSADCTGPAWTRVYTAARDRSEPAMANGSSPPGPQHRPHPHRPRVQLDGPTVSERMSKDLKERLRDNPLADGPRAEGPQTDPGVQQLRQEGYFLGFADVAERLLEGRGDDPEPA